MQNRCGMYSLRGLLNQNAAMNQHLPGSSALMQGASSCELKSEDEAPLIIYKSADVTRKGNEDVIDENGNFFRLWQDLLVVKTHMEVLEPWTHEVQLEVLETSILEVFVQSPQADNMAIKIMGQSTGTKFTPAISTITETATDQKELKNIFKVEPGRAYLIEIEFTGDMYNMHGDADLCVYYDLAISVNSLKSLGEAFSCTKNDIIKDMPSLVEELPATISQNDLDFSMKGLYKITYP